MNVSLVAKSVLVMGADWSVEMVLNLSIMSGLRCQRNNAELLELFNIPVAGSQSGS